MRDLLEVITEVVAPIILIVCLGFCLVALGLISIYHLAVSSTSKTDEQVQCESVEGAVWGQHACFKDGIKLNFAEP